MTQVKEQNKTPEKEVSKKDMPTYQIQSSKYW